MIDYTFQSFNTFDILIHTSNLPTAAVFLKPDRRLIEVQDSISLNRRSVIELVQRRTNDQVNGLLLISSTNPIQFYLSSIHLYA